MHKICKNELKEIKAGQNAGFWLCISAGVVFLIGLLDGMVRPYKCN